MLESYKFKVGDKVFKPKGYKFPGTVVSIFHTTGGDVRIVAEMADNGMLHIFNESQLEPLVETELLPNVSECERIAKSMINNTILSKKSTIPEAKEKVIKIIDDLMRDQQLPAFLYEHWGNVKKEVEKI